MPKTKKKTPMPRFSKKPVPRTKKALPAKKAVPVKNAKKGPDASITLPSFGKLMFELRVEAWLKNEKVDSFQFVSEGPDSFQRVMTKSCALFEGKTHDEAEAFSFQKFLGELSPSPDEREYALYAWTALQDVISRLPFNDPLSKAISRLHFLNREFKYGTLLPDLED